MVMNGLFILSIIIQCISYILYFIIHVSLIKPTVSDLSLRGSTPPKYCPIAAASNIKLKLL